MSSARRPRVVRQHLRSRCCYNLFRLNVDKFLDWLKWTEIYNCPSSYSSLLIRAAFHLETSNFILNCIWYLLSYDISAKIQDLIVPTVLWKLQSLWTSPLTLVFVNCGINSEMAFSPFRSQYHHFSLLSSDCEFNSHISHVYSDVCINTRVIFIPNQFILVQQCYTTRNKFFKCTYIHQCLFHLKLANIQHGDRIEAVVASLQETEPTESNPSSAYTFYRRITVLQVLRGKGGR